MFKNNLELCMKARTICHNNGPKTLNYLQQVLNRPIVYNLDIKGINNFFDALAEEVSLTEGQDCLIMNGKLFDWKEFNDYELVYEFINKLEGYVNKDCFNKFSLLVETHK